MNAEKIMNIEEVKQFFSSIDNFKINIDGNIIELIYENNNRTTSTLISAKSVNFKILINSIERLVSNYYQLYTKYC